jgi:predicted MFS family arabinose efflux permease
MAALGGGAVLGALVLARLDFERPTASLLLWAALVASTATLSLAFVHRFWVAAPILFAAGFAQILFAASSNTTLQMRAPDALRGRMMSLYAWVFVGSTPIGALFIGSVAERLGVLAACAAGGGCVASVAILAAWWKRRRA